MYLNPYSLLVFFSLKRFYSDGDNFIEKIFLIRKISLRSSWRFFRTIVVINNSWALRLVIGELAFIIFSIVSLLVFGLVFSLIFVFVFLRPTLVWLLVFVRLYVLFFSVPWTFRGSVFLESVSSELPFVIMHLNYTQLI